MTDGFTWNSDIDHRANRIRHAIRESNAAFSRVRGMKIRAEMDPPRAAPFHFPYMDHRTQAETPVVRVKGVRVG